MKKLTWLSALALCFTLPAMTGCGPGENTVIEAPPEASTEEPAMEGMSDDDYDEQMDAEMEG